MPSPSIPLSSWLSVLFKRSSRGWLAILLLVLVVYPFTFGVPGSTKKAPTRSSWSWRKRAKASEGLIKTGGSRGLNESHTVNLLPDHHYITSFHHSGLNNQILTQFNLLHLAFLLRTNSPSTAYTPVLPPFYPHFSHLAKDHSSGAADLPPAPVLRFSQVFDIDRLAEDLGWGIVEFSELKQGFTGRGTGGWLEDEFLTEQERRESRKDKTKWLERPLAQELGLAPEKIGCWSSWMSVSKGGNTGSGYVPSYYNLDPIFTPIPISTFSRTNRMPPHIILPSLANLLSPPENRLREEYFNFRNGEADEMIASWGHNETRDEYFGAEAEWIEPNVQPGTITCFDILYYASDKGEEIREAYQTKPPLPRDAGAWWSVGQHAHWNPELEKISTDILRTVLGLGRFSSIPNILTVHIRRTDFMGSCPEYAKPCFAVEHFANHIAGFRYRFNLAGRSGVKDWPVVVTTDESDPAYLAEIAALGWFLVDHDALKTAEIHGRWYPSLVDNVLLAMGQGFVGTSGSTMSILASRRVEDWNGGEAELASGLESRYPYDPITGAS